MKREKVAIYGIGALAKKIFEYNKRDGLYDIECFIDDKEGIELSFCGLPTKSYGLFKKYYGISDIKIFVAIGYVKCNLYRELVSKRVVEDGYELANYISPHSICWEGTVVGKNIFVADNVFIGHGSKVHDGVILYEGCTFSHDIEIESNCFVSLSVSAGGYTKIGHNSFVGLHSTIKDDVIIGAYIIIGCGANVIRSTEEKCLIVGNPGVSKKVDTQLMLK